MVVLPYAKNYLSYASGSILSQGPIILIKFTSSMPATEFCHGCFCKPKSYFQGNRRFTSITAHSHSCSLAFNHLQSFSLTLTLALTHSFSFVHPDPHSLFSDSLIHSHSLTLALTLNIAYSQSHRFSITQTQLFTLINLHSQSH